MLGVRKVYILLYDSSENAMNLMHCEFGINHALVLSVVHIFHIGRLHANIFEDVDIFCCANDCADLAWSRDGATLDR